MASANGNGAERITLEYVTPGSLSPAPYNPRSMTDEARGKLKRGVQKFGIVDPIVVRREDNLVVGGHQRLAVALELGLSSVPVAYIEKLTDSDAAALNVLLNNPDTQGDWDFSKLSDLLSTLDSEGYDATLTGFDEKALEDLLTWTPETLDADSAFGNLPIGDKSPFEQMTFTLTADQADTVREAMEAAKQAGEYGDTGNANSNGNALARIAEFALGAFARG